MVCSVVCYTFGWVLFDICCLASLLFRFVLSGLGLCCIGCFPLCMNVVLLLVLMIL